MSRWWCVSKAPTSIWAKRFSRTPALPIITGDDLGDAAEKIVKAVKEAA